MKLLVIPTVSKFHFVIRFVRVCCHFHCYQNVSVFYYYYNNFNFTLFLVFSIFISTIHFHDSPSSYYSLFNLQLLFTAYVTPKIGRNFFFKIFEFTATEKFELLRGLAEIELKCSSVTERWAPIIRIHIKMKIKW